MADSPAHYLSACQDHREETLSMRLGSGTHAILFGTPRVVVYRGGEFPDSKGKIKTYSSVRSGACWEAFEKGHAGDCILSESEFAKAQAMARAITANMAADSLLFADGAEHEKEIQWHTAGRLCRGRLDAMTAVAIPDLKTTRDADPRHFPRQAFDMRWPEQATWYADGANASGYGWRHPYLIAVENSPPYSVVVWRLTDEVIEYARANYRRWLDRVIECEESGLWPGFATGEIDMYLPQHLKDRK